MPARPRVGLGHTADSCVELQHQLGTYRFIGARARLAIPADLDLHLQDLRHTGSTWSAQSGATLKELMARIGHSSTRAAMIYQHASRDRDEAIAGALDASIVEARKRAQQ
jgi:integrase